MTFYQLPDKPKTQKTIKCQIYSVKKFSNQQFHIENIKWRIKTISDIINVITTAESVHCHQTCTSKIKGSYSVRKKYDTRQKLRSKKIKIIKK